MVVYIKSDLEFILKQIKISEAHAAGQPLFGPGADGISVDNPATVVDESADNGLIPAYNIAWGLRTVDGSTTICCPARRNGVRPTRNSLNC